jgi:segregation and condensation protein A
MSGIISAMSAGSFSTQAYQVVTPVYEGPLDLLLQLIEKAELDITRLALAQVTDQFLAYLHDLPERNASDVSSFLIIAAKLIQIKSEALLPRQPVREPGEEDPGEALARQLMLYKRFKEKAGWLGEHQGEHVTYPRLAPAPTIEPTLDMSGLTLEDLFLAAQFILSQEDPRTALGEIVSLPKITIREKIFRIAAFLKSRGRGSFAELLSNPARRLEVVMTFLALLELIKRNMVQANQDNLFGEIKLQPAEAWEDDLAFELEFGE